MSVAIFRAMLLGLIRDRGALVTSFILPPIFFAIFAEISAVAAGNEMNLRVAIADEIRTETSVRLLRSLTESAALQIVGTAPDTAESVRQQVRLGTADVGIVLRRDAGSLEGGDGYGDAPILIVNDPSRSVAVSVLAGEIRRAYLSALPDIAMRNAVEELESQFIALTPEQRGELDEGLAEMKKEAMAGGERTGWTFEKMLATEAVAGQRADLNPVAYFAGAVAFMFLLFASMHGAITLLEERESGVLDRILAGPGGIGVLVNGKYLYLVLQGFVQVTLIFLVAWLGYGVDLPGNFGPWAFVTIIAVLAAASLAMFITMACRTRRQAQTISNVLVLILSALGGSMVPRFLMPEFLRALGWATPNTWALEAYAAVLWRDQPLLETWVPLGLLLATAVLGLWLANLLARRMVAS